MLLGRESTRTKVGRDGWLHRARSRKRRHYRCRLPPTAYLTALPTKTVKPTRRRQTRHFTQLDQVTQLVAARDADPDLGFMARLLALCSLPRTNPKNRHEFKRVNGPYTLYMVAGGGNKLPYGTLPRLLLAWVCTEAVRTQSPELILGDSLSEFMRKVGIYSTSGDKHTRLRNQMRRLFGCTVSLMYKNTRGEATLNAPIARLTEYWWSERQPDARAMGEQDRAWRGLLQRDHQLPDPDRHEHPARDEAIAARPRPLHWQGNGLQNRKGAALKSKPRPFGPLE